MTDPIRINRAPVLTLWAAMVAERLGLDSALAQPLPTLAHQVWPGLNSAEPHALGVGAETRHGLPESQGERLVEAQPRGHRRGTSLVL